MKPFYNRAPVERRVMQTMRIDMIELLILCIGFFIGYYVSGYKWSSNSRDYRRIEFFGTLYKVLRDDDPIFNPSDDDIARMRIGAIIRRHENTTDDVDA